jgi:hypothetical protein
MACFTALNCRGLSLNFDSSSSGDTALLNTVRNASPRDSNSGSGTPASRQSLMIRPIPVPNCSMYLIRKNASATSLFRGLDSCGCFRSSTVIPAGKPPGFDTSKRFHARLAKAVDAEGRPHPVLQGFARHLREHLLVPSGRGGGHGGARASWSGAGCFTYEPPPGVVWSAECGVRNAEGTSNIQRRTSNIGQ